MATMKDAEAGVPMEQATAAQAAEDGTASKKSRLLLASLIGLLFCMAIAAIAVGSVALNKVNELDMNFDQLASNVCTDHEPMLVPGASVTFPPLMPNPPFLVFVPAFQDPTWFGTPGNRLLYSMDPMFPEGTTNFTLDASIGTVSGVMTVLKPLDDPNAAPMFHSLLTFQLDGTEGEAVVGGIDDIGGTTTTHLPILGGSGAWEHFSGYLQSEFDPVTTQVSLKLYQTCSQ